MPVLRRSTRHRCGKHKVEDHMADHLGDQIDEVKVEKHMTGHLGDQIDEVKVEKHMNGHLGDQIHEVKVENHMTGHLGDQIDEVKVEKHMNGHPVDRINEFKVGKRVVHQPTDDRIIQSKVVKPMADQPVDVQTADLKSDVTFSGSDGYKLGSGVIGLNTQVITVQPGEDVAMKVASYSTDGWAVCILSADGAVSSVAFNHAPSSLQTVFYEGYFQILSLAGSYMLLESGGLRIRKGGVRISVAGPDGRVFGGGVAGSLTAASLVQVVIGRFPVTSDIQGASSSTERGAMGGTSGGPGIPRN